MRLLVVRHGQTDLNAEGVLQGPRIDGELSATGHQQARDVAAALRDEPLQRIFSSPLRRARDTAQAVVDAHPDHPVVEVVPELYEMDYGTFAGQRVDAIREGLEQTFDAWRMGFSDEAFPGGESAVLAQHRVRPFAARLRGIAAAEDVLVVGHGRINRILLATLLGRGLHELDAFPQDNGGITELRATAAGFGVVRVNDTAHLGTSTSSVS